MQRVARWFIMSPTMHVTTGSALLIVGVPLGMLLQDAAVPTKNQMIFAFVVTLAN
jgi:hypothetical protein